MLPRFHEFQRFRQGQGITISGFSGGSRLAAAAETRASRGRDTPCRRPGCDPPHAVAPRSIARRTIATSRSAREPPPLVTSSITGFIARRSPSATSDDVASSKMTPLPAGLKSVRERAGCERNIAVDETREPFRLVGEDHRLHQKKELELLFGEPADGCHQSRHIVINLLLHDGGGMPLGGLEMPAVLGALDLNQALGGTADGADVVAERRTPAFRGSLPAERADFHKQTVSGSSSTQFPWILRGARRCKAGVWCKNCHTRCACDTLRRFGPVPWK